VLPSFKGGLNPFVYLRHLVHGIPMTFFFSAYWNPERCSVVVIFFAFTVTRLDKASHNAKLVDHHVSLAKSISTDHLIGRAAYLI
jgi:hypothetical protein